MGPQFFETVMGSRFFNSQLPEITKQLKRVADALEKQNVNSEERTEIKNQHKDVEWISSKYEVPPNDDYVLLSFANFDVPIVGRYEEAEDGSGNFYAGDEDETLLSQNMIVNAWMPLPIPKREENN